MALKPADVVAVKVRMREGLRQILAGEAKRNKHSLNREIERRLQKSLEAEMTVLNFKLIAGEAARNAVDSAYARLGLGKPSDMVTLIEKKLGRAAARKFAVGLIDSASRKAKTDE